MSSRRSTVNSALIYLFIYLFIYSGHGRNVWPDPGTQTCGGSARRALTEGERSPEVGLSKKNEGDRFLPLRGPINSKTN